MTNLEYGTLAGRRLAPVLALPLTATVYEGLGRGGERWLVLLDRDGVPLSAVHPRSLRHEPGCQTLLSVVPRLPPVVMASVDTPVVALLGCWFIDELEPESAVIAMAGHRAAGVWAGPDLMATVIAGTSRDHGDTELPGDITIPLLTRACRHAQEGVACGGVLRFPERPRRPPACPNPTPLAAHDFVW